MTSAVAICNRALQKIGASSIADLTENSRNAEQCNIAYDSVRKSELRRRRWAFATTRTSLAAEATAPDWGRSYAYNLPADWLREAPQDPRVQTVLPDALIESGQVLTDDAGPLYIRYIRDVEDANEFDPLFVEALAARLAAELCEVLTQSTSKKALLLQEYDKYILEAGIVSAIENGPTEQDEDEFISVRR